MTDQQKANNRARQKRYREKLKAKGEVRITITLPVDDEELLKKCYELTNDPGNTYNEFLHMILIRGAVFSANIGKGHRIKKINGRYQITEVE